MGSPVSGWRMACTRCQQAAQKCHPHRKGNATPKGEKHVWGFFSKLPSCESDAGVATMKVARFKSASRFADTVSPAAAALNLSRVELWGQAKAKTTQSQGALDRRCSETPASSLLYCSAPTPRGFLWMERFTVNKFDWTAPRLSCLRGRFLSAHIVA